MCPFPCTRRAISCSDRARWRRTLRHSHVGIVIVSPRGVLRAHGRVRGKTLVSLPLAIERSQREILVRRRFHGLQGADRGFAPCTFCARSRPFRPSVPCPPRLGMAQHGTSDVGGMVLRWGGGSDRGFSDGWYQLPRCFQLPLSDVHGGLLPSSVAIELEGCVAGREGAGSPVLQQHLTWQVPSSFWSFMIWSTTVFT